MTGEARNDLGQMAAVSCHAGSQVEISCQQSPTTGRWKTQQKQPALVLRMEEGVEMAIDNDGWPAIQRIPDHEEEIENESIGVASKDEARAQWDCAN